MSESVIVNLPFFPGFYESMLSGILDRAEEQCAEYEAEKESSKEYYPETFQPKTLRIDAGEYSEIIFDCMNYGAANQEMARDYCWAFDYWAQQNLETPADTFSFESMDSPREYNFTTDRAYCTVPFSILQGWLEAVDRSTLAQCIKDRFTSYDGFISGYSNDIDEWLEKPLADWDHNDTATLLTAVMLPHIDDKRDFNWTICEPICEQDYEYVDNNIDWDKFAEKIREKRAEKMAAWIVDDAEAAAQYVAHNREAFAVLEIALGELDSEERRQWEATAGIIAARFYRCPFTLELPFPKANA